MGGNLGHPGNGRPGMKSLLWLNDQISFAYCYDHSPMTVKQAAEVVNINKVIHYTHKTVYMYIWKGGKPFPRHHSRCQMLLLQKP